jgi:nucleotide-binding universal stress UspA family protein
MTGQDPAVQVGDEEARGPRVVVGVDGSPGSRAALLFALHDAARRGLGVEAITAYRPPDYWLDFYAVGTPGIDQARDAAVQRVRSFVAEVLPEGPQPPPAVRVRADLGSAADALVSASHQAELLVVGSKGHGGFTSMLLGSTSMQCVLHAVCPVTVVHSAEAHRERVHLRRGRRVGAGSGGLPAA